MQGQRKEKQNMTLGVIGKKLGMTTVFDDKGLAIPVTVIKVDKIVVTQVKTVETDGYNAIQVGTVPAKEKHLTKAQIGHLNKNKLETLGTYKSLELKILNNIQLGKKLNFQFLTELKK